MLARRISPNGEATGGDMTAPLTRPPSPHAKPLGDGYVVSPSRQWRLVLILTVVSMLSAVDRQALALLVEPIKANLHLSDGQMGILMGAAIAVTGLVIGPPAGFLADRICRRCMVGFSALAWSALTAACGFSGNFGQFLLARAGVGLFEGVTMPATASMLRDALSDDRRGRGFAVFSMAPLVGTGMAMLVGGALIAAFSAAAAHAGGVIWGRRPWQMVFITFGLLGLPAAAAVLLIAEPERGRDAADQAMDGTLAEAMAHLRAHWQLYVPLIAFGALHGMLSLSFAAWAPALLGRTWNLNPAEIGVTFGLMMLILSPIGLAVSGALIDRLARLGRPDAALIGIGVTVVIWIAASSMPVMPSPGLFWAMLAVLLLFSGTSLPVALTIMAEITPSRAMGKLTAVQGVITGLLSATLAPSIPPSWRGRYFAALSGLSAIAFRSRLCLWLVGADLDRLVASSARRDQSETRPRSFPDLIPRRGIPAPEAFGRAHAATGRTVLMGERPKSAQQTIWPGVARGASRWIYLGPSTRCSH